MNDIDGMQVGLALRDRLANEHPDLEHLATASLATGVQIQRRRRMVAGAGAAAAVVGVAALTLGLGLAGGGEGHSRGDDWAASSPSVAPGLQVGQKLDLGDGLTGTITTTRTGLYEMAQSTRQGSGSGFILVVHGPTDQINQWWSDGFGTTTEDWPGITLAMTTADAEALGMLGKVDKTPVTVPDGWTCEWYLADDKADCRSADGGVAGLVIRDADERAAWLASPDKGDDPSVYTTEPHKGIFISVQGGHGTTDAEIQELGERLTWVD